MIQPPDCDMDNGEGHTNCGHPLLGINFCEFQFPTNRTNKFYFVVSNILFYKFHYNQLHDCDKHVHSNNLGKL